MNPAPRQTPADPARAALVDGARRSDAVSLALYAAHVGVVLAPVYVAAWVGVGWPLLACWAWFGVFAHGLLLLLHECIHKLAFRNVRLNEALAYAIAPLFLTDFAAFRRRHWAHHRALGTASDPKYTYRVDIAGTAVLRLVARALLLVEGAAKMKLQGAADVERVSGRSLLWIAFVQTLFVTSVAATAALGHPDRPAAVVAATAGAYLFVYGYGIGALTPLVHTLRGIAEHRPCDSGEVVVGDAALRNFSPGLVERCVWGAYGFVEHATHHRHPALPAYRLAAVTRDAMREDPSLRPVGTHTEVLLRLVRRRASRFVGSAS